MNDSFSEAIKEAFASAPANEVIINTLEIRQYGVQASVFISQTRRGIVALDEDGNERTFLPVNFQFSLPPSNEEGFRSLNIAIDNIDRRVTEFIETAMSEEVPVEVIYRPYLSSDLTEPHMNPPLVLYLKDVQIQGFQVTGRATFMDLVNKKFPLELYTRGRFPTLG
jgi:hypothetical protein